MYVSMATRHLSCRTVRRKLEPSIETAAYGGDTIKTGTKICC